MAIVTDQTVTIHGVSVGISKPIQTLIADGDFTFDELSKFAYVGRYDFINDKCGIYEPDSYWQMAGTAAAIEALGKYPVINDPSAPNWDSKDYIYKGAENRTYDNYGKMVLVYNRVNSAKDINKNYNDGNTACIVTEFNPRLIKMMANCSASSITATVGQTGTYTFYDLEASINFVWMDDDSTAPFSSLCIQHIEDSVYFMFPLYDHVYNAYQTISGVRDSMYVTVGTTIDDYMQTGNKLLSVWPGGEVENFLQGANYSSNWTGVNFVSSDRGSVMLREYYDWYYAAGEFYVRAADLDTALKQLAACGCYFEANGTVYKPITEDGIVTGYTADLDKNGEWDLINDVKGNTIPDTPGGGGGDVDDEDNKDPISTTGAPFSAGLCHYYALTAGSTLLDHISEALGTWDIENTHKDLYKNLVSCKLIKPPAAIPTTGSAPFTIYGVKPQYQGADITLPVVTGNPDATFGPYTIDRKFGDFRDYAPYTRVSIYLPYCGWCDLPSHVVGRQVSVKYFTDIIAATCKAVVFCSNNIIAEAAGVIGLDIPFVADNVGAKMQAVTAGMIAALGGGIQLGAGIGTMVSTKSGSGAKAALSGASQYLSGYSQMAMAFNENTTEISGKNGDGCNLAGSTNIIIKIVRPKKGSYTTSPYTPPGYGHGIGFVSQKQVKVNSVSGLLIADNVDTSGISGATDAERAEIKRVLESGLIVNSPPA